MERATKVSVFESESTAEIQLIKTKLEGQGIECFVDNKYMSFTSTPTANTLSIMVDLKKEQDAFEIIDAYLLEQEQNDSPSE